MDLQQRKVYRTEKLGLTFSEGIGKDGDTSIEVHYEVQEDFNTPIIPDPLKELFHAIGIGYSQIKTHKL